MQKNIIYKMEKSQEYDNLKEGDYVIIKKRIDFDRKEVYPNVGKIIRARRHYDELDIYFEDDNKRYFGISYYNIIYSSENKEELEIILNQLKYNL
mgnify:CR=1 FL=1